ncbi:hypothetical protein EST38_g11979 [Candolleomyces aberdarensis]|uniref:Protein kinase domain-containing protein n=1 Tax=Candolleomyces aberdarensis TaxID=2316362 RepID=A0A4Q2D3J6_9AGAR|nr:hypothetical protein EST38_g11979 [Candolleomyces aberdarensis]
MLKHHLKELVPWLLEHRPIGTVPCPTNVAYFPFLPKPISLSPGTSKLDHLKLHYGSTTPKRFVLIQTLDGVGETNYRRFLATHEPQHPNDSRHFVALTVFVKSDGPVRLDAPTPRSILRRELRVHKRLAEVERKDREFVLATAGVMENERAHYLILPFTRCDLLDVLLKKVDIDKTRFARAWIAQLGDGLDCLHRNGIIHREVKPRNILIDWNGSVKISNFENAYIDHEGKPLLSGVSYAYSTRGTRPYVAPEVQKMIHKVNSAKGYMNDPDEQCTALKGYGKEVDVWSLGCVAAELLTAKERYEPIFRFHGCYEWLTAINDEYRLDQLEFYGIRRSDQANAADLVLNLLRIDHRRRLQLSEMKDHPYFTDCAEVAAYGRLLDTFIPRNERPRINYHLNLRARPKYPECVLELTATAPQKKIPPLDELSDYTWINPDNFQED